MAARRRNNAIKKQDSLNSLDDESATRLLDMGPEIEHLRQNGGQKTPEQDISIKPLVLEDEKDKNDENIGAPKMNTLVGFLRLCNFLSATTVIFILTVNLMNIQSWSDMKNVIENLLTCVQIAFLAIFAITTYIDSIGTISFSWREYGELSSLHTDATSIIFIFCQSRWIFRIGSGLIFITSLSLPIMDKIEALNNQEIDEDNQIDWSENSDILPNPGIWAAGLICGCFVSSGLGFFLRYNFLLPFLVQACQNDYVEGISYMSTNVYKTFQSYFPN